MISNYDNLFLFKDLIHDLNLLNTQYQFLINDLNFFFIDYKLLPLFENLLIDNSLSWYNLNYVSNIPDEFYYIENELKKKQINQPKLTLEQIFNKFFDSNNYNNFSLDTSNSENINLALSVDNIDNFEALEHVRSLYSSTAPNVKLYYPEPFIASPSFVHNDIGYIHILQYQFWLWFLFVFLICFFFISFICVVRWCTNRVQPRRETRGVSRSKCGDLITATVPVTWAISIIVSESTDATDYYDGFGTGELAIGVRAYQWGWHYYYPKNIDLNYNVKPNYSSFVGNSLKYNSTTTYKLQTNSLWKFYQSKIDDTIISPAHLLVIPGDNSNLLNLLSFKNIGVDMLEASKAFKQIRASARVYTTNLNFNISTFSNKYSSINNLFFNENTTRNSNSFGLKRQHNLTSSFSTTSIYSTFLDKKSLLKFLNFNLKFNKNEFETALPKSINDLWIKEFDNSLKLESLNNLKFLIQNNFKTNNKSLKTLSLYPNLIKEFGDNSDIQSEIYPLRKISKKKFNKLFKIRYNNKDLIKTSINQQRFNSKTSNFFKTQLLNKSTTKKDFMISYKFSAIDPNFQIQNLYTNLDVNKTNLNLSKGLNNIDSNLTKFKENSNFLNISNLYWLNKANWVDLTSFNKISSNKPLYENVSPILSTNPLNPRNNYSRMFSTNIKSYYSNNKDNLNPLYRNYIFENDNFLNKENIELQVWETKNSTESKLYVKEKASELNSLTSVYWKMFFASTDPLIRVNSLLQDYKLKETQLFANLVNYYDYNFNNAQNIKFFEDLSWESIYSGYNHNDYLKIFKKYREVYDNRSYKWSFQNLNNLLTNRDSELVFRFGTNAKSKNLKNIGFFYSNTIQSDDYFLPIHLLNIRDYSDYSYINNLLLLDDSYRNIKNLTNNILTKSSISLNYYSCSNFPQSHYSVLNNFRSDFEDFSFFQNNSLNLNVSNLFDTNTLIDLPKKLTTKTFNFNTLRATKLGSDLEIGSQNNVDVNQNQANGSRFSNPIVLRRTAKNSIVTHQAFQKVFKLRYEEGRAHVRLTDYANSTINQPYTTEQKSKYERMLGKTRLKFFNTNYNLNKSFKVFNNLASLSNSLNFYFYEFPFLDGVTNDPTRHVWFDTYIKYAQREVSGSSVSKYTISGVPFFKKKFDFNLKKGRQLADSELFFTRMAISRKNYLPLWVYTPYLYSRSQTWFNNSKINTFNFTKTNNLINLQLNLENSDWYWTNPFFSKDTSLNFTPSFSQTYKAFHRPYNAVQGYQYSLKTLTDILSKREYIYRQTLERRNKIIELPNILRATPKHPLIEEVKASFLLIDPITYNSEYSREFYYSSLNYFKYLIFKNVLMNTSYILDQLPINLKLLNHYLFFHFFEQKYTKTTGLREDLMKSQFKPLKRGISNMMRLQGSGAVAMPIEIRLHVLASSKDVIHSWAIPSAGIKIDCIPGYSSHRIMIFFTPGIYWGQCMEICGRYHHWMPIIIYFMKRDMFFLWCTHFLSKKDPYATQYWEANDRQFSDYINLVTFNKSSWLTELKL